MNPKLKIGDIVWYHISLQPHEAVKARITSVGRKGVTGAPCYSLWRLDCKAYSQTHHVPERHLSRPFDTTIPPQPYLTKKECPHV